MTTTSLPACRHPPPPSQRPMSSREANAVAGQTRQQYLTLAINRLFTCKWERPCKSTLSHHPARHARRDRNDVRRARAVVVYNFFFLWTTFVYVCICAKWPKGDHGPRGYAHKKYTPVFLPVLHVRPCLPEATPLASLLERYVETRLDSSQHSHIRSVEKAWRGLYLPISHLAAGYFRRTRTTTTLCVLESCVRPTPRQSRQSRHGPACRKKVFFVLLAFAFLISGVCHANGWRDEPRLIEHETGRLMPLLGPSRPDFRSQGVRSKVTTRQCKKCLSLTTPFSIARLRTLTYRAAAILDFHMQTFHQCTLSKPANAADPQDGPAAQAPSSPFRAHAKRMDALEQLLSRWRGPACE